MNFKKLHYLPICSLIFFNGCASFWIKSPAEDEKRINHEFVGIIRSEIKKTAGLDKNSPPPRIEYKETCYEYTHKECYAAELCDEEAEQKRLEKLKLENKKEWKKCRKRERDDALGVFFFNCQNIDICLRNIRNSIFWNKNRPALSREEAEAVFYNTVAHELWHHALFLLGEISKHHQIMKERGYLEKTIDFISRHFDLSPDGIQKEMSMKSLEKGVELEKEEDNEAEKSRFPLLMKCGGSPATKSEFQNPKAYIKCK